MKPEQTRIFKNTVNAVASQLKRPLLYGPDGRPIRRQANLSFSRSAGKRAGSMKNWIPKRLFGAQSESRERERIAERAIDLGNNDPHAAGVIDTFATTVIGAGLTPHFTVDPSLLGIEKDQAREIRTQLKNIYTTWFPWADAGGRMSMGGIQFLIECNLVQFNEYIMLLHMIDDPARPYSLACQIVHPLRMKTPVDLRLRPDIRDGVEIGKFGEPKAYWIKKAGAANGVRPLPDTSKNFLRIPARSAHRWKVLHGFVAKEAEQVRGVSSFAPSMKFFRDLNDYLDAELVSNIVTAAFSLFIEAAGDTDPGFLADNLSGFSEEFTNKDGDTETRRYQEMIPGQIMYGNAGEKPQTIAANRPGATFDPFTKIVKKAISMSMNIPYPVLFKDTDGVSFAGFRSAMLEAWRVFTFRRQFIGQGPSQKTATMLIEEAWLRGDLKIDRFYGRNYSRMYMISRADWRGAPKGDIEPIKAVKADLLAIKGNIKTHEQAIIERGGEPASTFDTLEEENNDLRSKNLVPAADQQTDSTRVDGENNADVIADAVVDAMEERQNAA